jgi:4-methyl-5(b-hydroxyethyl)-thiazole monophosphate biosynthesis
MASSKTALVPIANGSEEMEAVIVADVLRRAAVHVTIASCEKQVTVECSRGVHIVADVLIGDCLTEDYDVVILPGGMPGAEHLRDNKVR